MWEKERVFEVFVQNMWFWGNVGRQNSAYLEFFIVIFVTVGDFGDNSILDKNLYHQFFFA